MSRRDYLDDPHAPSPNSIVVACSAFVQNRDSRLLMIRRSDNELYSIPGGQVEPGESLTETAVRETREETGIEIAVVGLVGIFSNPRHVIEYSDGEVRQEFSVCFRAQAVGGALRTSMESTEAQWVDLSLIGSLPVHQSTRLRIEHALSGKGPFYT